MASLPILVIRFKWKSIDLWPSWLDTPEACAIGVLLMAYAVFLLGFAVAKL